VEAITGLLPTIREVAGWFGFKYIDLLIAELPQAKLDTFEKDAVWYQSYRAAILVLRDTTPL
jgi:hypothetical protein